MFKSTFGATLWLVDTKTCTLLKYNEIQHNISAIKPTIVKLVMFTFCWDYVREVLIELQGYNTMYNVYYSLVKLGGTLYNML